jgi:hypothetical protein
VNADEPDIFAMYGELAMQGLPPIMVSGRHLFHDRFVPVMVDDVAAKLDLHSQTRLLEIGCGLGLLLRPLSASVESAVGIDHPAIIEQFQNERPPSNVSLLAGRFPECNPEGPFDAVLANSVLHCCTTADEAIAFVDAGGVYVLVASLHAHVRERPLRAESLRPSARRGLRELRGPPSSGLTVFIHARRSLDT